MRTYFVLLILLITSVGTANAQNVRSDGRSRAERELLQRNNEYDAALVRGDAEVLDTIYVAEFVYTSFDGSVRTKDEQLAFTRTGDLRFESGSSDDVKIRIYGNTAVMTGRFTAKGTYKGKPLHVRERYTAVWVKTKGKWRLVAEQGNEIK